MKLAALLFTGMMLVATPAAAQFNAFKDPVQGSATGAASGPDLKAVATAAIAGGKVTVGATAYVVAVFKNPGTSPVNVTGINLYPSSTVSAKVSLNKCAEAPLPPEAECAVTVAVTGLQLGSWRVELLLDHDGRTRLATAAMIGDVEGGGDDEDEKVKSEIEASPDVLDFGTSEGGVSMVRSIVLRNRTSEAVTLKSISLDAPPQTGLTQKSQCPEVLQPGETCNVLVTWLPVTKGLTQGVLLVTHSARSGTSQAEIKGAYEPASISNAEIYPTSVAEQGIMISDKDKIDFGSAVNGASAITVSLVNAGSADLTIKNVMLSGSDSGVSIMRSGCRTGSILKPMDACPLTVNWVPSRQGPVIDDLQVHHTGARGVLILPVRGTATAAVSRESLAVRQTSTDTVSESGGGMVESISITPVLDGYVVTSHSPTRAIINGPVGSIVVRDGEDVVISRVKWTVTIVPTGVILTSAEDEIFLIFDKSLRPATPAASTGAAAAAIPATTTTTTQSTGTTP